jgi:anti-sigma factor RsiW
MNEALWNGPCAAFELDLAESQDGLLDAERARVLNAHVEQCPRCRAWQEQLAALDAGLAESLPTPELSPGFNQALAARIAALTQPASRDARRIAADRERDALIDTLRRGARRHALLDAIGSVAVIGGVLTVAPQLLGWTEPFLEQLRGETGSLVFGGVAAAVALVALAWSASRGALSGVR